MDTVWHERAEGIQQSVFQLLYFQHKTFKEAEDILFRRKKARVYDCSLVAIKEKLWLLFGKEIEFCFQNCAEQPFVVRLTAEANSALTTIAEDAEEESIDEQTKRKTG